MIDTIVIFGVLSTDLNIHDCTSNLDNKKSCIFSVGARDVYERAVEFFGEENADEKLFLSFAKFEENCKEVWIEALEELLLVVGTSC